MQGHLKKPSSYGNRQRHLDTLCSSCYLFRGKRPLSKPGSTTKPIPYCRKLCSWILSKDTFTSSWAVILLARGRPQDALAEMQQEPNEGLKLAGEVIAYHSLGRRQASDAALKKLIATHGSDGVYQIAEAYAYRGEKDKALKWLERAYQQHDSGMAFSRPTACSTVSTRSHAILNF